MVTEQDSDLDAQKSVPLKFAEPAVNSDNPWSDDLLDRQAISTRLTDLLANQDMPLTISLHGQWGTGKTFMLKRWQKALENDGYQAIYFNAWEDDYSADPLLAIMGQLSDHFKDGALKALALKAAHYAIPLMVENILSVAKATVGVTLKVDQQDNHKHPLLDTYLEQRDTKDRLKTQLASLSGQVFDQTLHPLVFIIDELDRCRPTYAIELLERVKHIFDVPNLVFVLGLNRDELCNSIKSIYGEINADVYLRRFFDMEFNLPEGGSKAFARHLMMKYSVLSLSDKGQVAGQSRDVDVLVQDMPTLWEHLGLSLRDIDYCVRLVTLVVASLQPSQPMYPLMLGLLMALKIQTPLLYHEFVEGGRLGSEVMDHIYKSPTIHDQYSFSQEVLVRIESYLYLADKRFGMSANGGAPALDQLRLLETGSELTRPEYISKSTRTATVDKLRRLIQLIEKHDEPGLFSPYPAFPPTAIRYISSLIDLNQDLVKR